MFDRVRPMLRKEFIHVLRDPRMKGILFVMPVVQVLIFGYAVTTDVKHVRTAVYDLDNGIESRKLIARFVHSGYFDITAYVSEDDAARRSIDRGQVQAVLHVNKDFGADVRAGRTAEVQIIVDGTDSNAAGIILSYSSKIVQEFSRNVLASRFVRLQGRLLRLPQVELVTRAWFNENLESRDFYVPGVIALIITLMTLMLTSMAIVREKEIGTIEQIMATPITQLEFILGKTVPFILIGFLDVVLIALTGVVWFEVPIRGSPLLLLAASTLYIMTAIGIGLLISTISHTQQQAMMATFFFYMPAMLLSGFVFPIANMPTVIQWLTYVNPLRYFLVIIRGIFLKGVGADILWPQMAALGVIGLATLYLAAKRFKKTLA